MGPPLRLAGTEDRGDAHSPDDFPCGSSAAAGSAGRSSNAAPSPPRRGPGHRQRRGITVRTPPLAPVRTFDSNSKPDAAVEAELGG